MGRSDFAGKVVEQMIGRRASLVAVVDRIGADRMPIAPEMVRWMMANPRAGRLGQRHLCVLPVEALDWDVYTRRVAEWLQHEEMVEPSYSSEGAARAFTPQHFWEMAADALENGVSGEIVVIIDGMSATAPLMSARALYEALARLRAFVSEWRRDEIDVHHVVVGAWSTLDLLRQFDMAHTSWPFDAGHTILDAPAWTPDELRATLQKMGASVVDVDLYGRYLYELTSGDPWAVQGTLATLRTRGEVSCDALAEAAQAFARAPACQRELLRRYEGLSAAARAVLHRVLQGGYALGGRTLSRELEELELSGWLTFVKTSDDERRIGRLRSWVVEYGLRRSDGALRGNLPAGIYKNADELLPPVRCLNQDAYEIVCEIENHLRNLVLLRRHVLDAAQGAVKSYPLVGQRTSTLMAGSQNYADEHQRMQASRRHFLDDKGLVVTHAPLISFSTTQPLLDLIGQMAVTDQDDVLIHLRKIIDQGALDRFKELRDAVAHNQLVSERALHFLRDLRARLLNALAV
jgi:hypothetical protein